MKILALVKYSLDIAEIRVDPNTKELRMSGVPKKIGDIDKNVVEAAVQIKELFGADLQGLSFGSVARESFKDVLAMGLDEVFIIEDPFEAAIDGAIVARILETAIRKLGPFDLIFCGFASDDGYTYQIGPRLAERLDLPLVSYARHISLSDGKIQADRDLEDNLQIVEVPLPALISIAEEAFTPRRTTLMGALKAKEKPVNILQVEEDLGLSIAELAHLRNIVSVSQIGVVVQRKQNVFKDKTLVELADQLIDELLNDNVLKVAE